MSEKYIVFGATGSIGSSLAEQLVSSGNNVHLVARNEAELKDISDKLDPIEPVAPKITYFSDIKNFISYI